MCKKSLCMCEIYWTSVVIKQAGCCITNIERTVALIPFSRSIIYSILDSGINCLLSRTLSSELMQRGRENEVQVDMNAFI